MSKHTDEMYRTLRQVARNLSQVGMFIAASADCDTPALIDWRSTIRWINDELLLGAGVSCWDDPAKHRAVYEEIIAGLETDS